MSTKFQFAFAGIWLATAILLLPGTIPLVVNVTPVNTAVVVTEVGTELGDALSAKFPGDAVALPEDTFGSAPRALATATGNELRPGFKSAACVMNLLAVLTSANAAVLLALAVGAAITDVDALFE